MEAIKYFAAAATCLHISFQHTIFAQKDFDILDCWTPCALGFTGNEIIPGTGCKYYHECWAGQVRAQKECGAPLVFNEELDYCDFPSAVYCPLGESKCPGSKSERPTGSPTETPTWTWRTEAPPTWTWSTEAPQTSPPPPSTSPTLTMSKGGPSTMSHIESKRDLIEKYVMISYNPSGLSYPSKSYKYEDFIQALQKMGVEGFGADFKFDLWEGHRDKYHYGLINLAAFLANAMVESIESDTCDELNWQHLSGRYAISNSCGQESRSYQDETCDTDEDIFSCLVIPSMDIMSVSSSSAEARAPPMRCEPGSGQLFHSGYWDSISGALFEGAPYSNDLGRTDTEGCCFWGRGALLTRGVCNIGKANYYLGKGGAQLGRSTLYPTVDFCEYPETTCASIYSDELRWTVAFFEWAERVQRYNERDKWAYEERIRDFIYNGMTDDSFIESVSRILSRGCHAPGCSEFEVRNLDKRRSNFYLILNDIFDIKTFLNPPIPTQQPTTPRPTQRPNRPATKQPTPWPTAAIGNTLPSPAGLPPPEIVAMPTTLNPSKDWHIISPHADLPSNDNQGPTPSQTGLTSTSVDSSPAAPTMIAGDDNPNESSADTLLIGLEGNSAVIISSLIQNGFLSMIIGSAAYYLLW